MKEKPRLGPARRWPQGRTHYELVYHAFSPLACLASDDLLNEGLVHLFEGARAVTSWGTLPKPGILCLPMRARSLPCGWHRPRS